MKRVIKSGLIKDRKQWERMHKSAVWVQMADKRLNQACRAKTVAERALRERGMELALSKS